MRGLDVHYVLAEKKEALQYPICAHWLDLRGNAVCGWVLTPTQTSG